MTLKILPTAVCRSPLFSYDTQMKDKWDELKNAIKSSSRNFYTLIEHVSVDEIDQLEPKIKFACWKYFNRARYRATPFGSFGSITLFPLTAKKESLFITSTPHLKHFFDWSCKDIITENISKLYQDARYLLANSTTYSSGRQLRYVSVNRDNVFELSSIDKQPLIEDILNLYKTPAAKEAALDLLATRYKLQPEIASDLIKQLIELQLLMTDKHPNIIGDDYFKRIAFSATNTSTPYTLSARKRISGSLNKKELAVVPEAILFLSTLQQEAAQLPLSTFKTKFQLKFEYREVPLLLALDPELGVGYDNLEDFSMANELTEILKDSGSFLTEPQKIPYDSFHQTLLNELLKKKDNIQLDELEKLGSNRTPREALNIPNTLNAIIQISDQQIILEQAGGVTATALLGRFSLEDLAITDYCREISAIEQEANPQIIFFDIAYQAEKTIDNINRRSAIYPQELSLLSWPSASKQLVLSDIMVSVKRDEIVLRSKTHQQRLIPRLTSAYNYKRSDLSVYRFLCDLQQQNLQTNPHINPRNLFPNLHYYPRISYKNLVISPRMWQVPLKFQQQSLKPTVALLKEWLLANNVSSSFKCGYHDQFLLFDTNNEEDLHFFLQHITGASDHHYITEVFAPRKDLLNDQINQPYAGQYIIQLYHKERLFSPAPLENHEWNRQEKSLVLPGKEWLYVEIYTHPSRSNLLLMERIRPYLRGVTKYIKSWFFVRYTHPSAHIRLRIRLKHERFFPVTLTILTSILEEDIRLGIISDLQIKPYQRETERYGLQEIEAIETHFWLESKYSILLIQQDIADNDRYLLVIRFLNDLLDSAAFKHTSKLAFVQRIAKSLAREMSITTRGFKKINESFMLIKKQGAVQTSRNLENAYQKMHSHAAQLLDTVDRTKCLQLVGDFVHMHVNRLFFTDQRVHELIIYQYFQKLLMASQKHSTPPI